MTRDCSIIVDIGKTNAKLSLWDADGNLLDRLVRTNVPQNAAGYRALDVVGIDDWLMTSLRDLAGQAHIAHIIPVGHGAAAALLTSRGLFCPPMDYEDEPQEHAKKEYVAQRDAFEFTGSPLLPFGLNLGMQLHRLEEIHGRFPETVNIVPWPQYWAWRLCGVAASEVSSLGCHSDLWRPMTASFSALAKRRGWAARFAPLRRAADRLGTITAQVAAQTGLPETCEVLCGLHDSNAALLAARGHREIADSDATVLSTGTWFVAMRSLRPGVQFEQGSLAEDRDCLINVDVFGNTVPSARFMGGREAELLGGVDSFAPADHDMADDLIKRLPALLANGVAAFPSFVFGVGPYPHAKGEWRNKPADIADRRAIAGVYLALMANASLNLIGSHDRLLIEGRFAEATVFVRALASLRPQQQIYISNAHQDVAYGALRLVNPDLQPSNALTPVEPLPIELQVFAAEWHERAMAAKGAT